MVAGLDGKSWYKYSEYEYQDNSYLHGVAIAFILKKFQKQSLH